MKKEWIPELKKLKDYLLSIGYLSLQFIPGNEHDSEYLRFNLLGALESERRIIDTAVRNHPILYEHTINRGYYFNNKGISPFLMAMENIFLRNNSFDFKEFHDLPIEIALILNRLADQPEFETAEFPYRFVPVFNDILVADPKEQCRRDSVFFLRDSCLLASFIRDRCNLRGKDVVDCGTGTGVLGFAAIDAGANRVLGIDINPKAVLYSDINRNLNGYNRFTAAEGNFKNIEFDCDVVISNPPYMPIKTQNSLAAFGKGFYGLKNAIDLVERLKGIKAYMIIPSPVTLEGNILDRYFEKVIRFKKYLIESQKLVPTLPAHAALMDLGFCRRDIAVYEFN